MAYRNSPVRIAAPDRREFIFQLAAGIGSVALSSLIRQDEVRAGILAREEAPPSGESQGMHLSPDGRRPESHRHV